MAYEDYEISEESSQPIELITITIGADIFRMTNQSKNFDYGGDTYVNTAIEHGRITTGEETITIIMDAENGYPQMYTTSAPGRVATVTIVALQAADPTDAKVIYKGVVRTVGFSKDMTQAKVIVIPITAAFDKAIPDRTYQAGCNHVLFSTECSIGQFSYRHQGEVIAVSGNVVTVDGLSFKGVGWSTGGFAGFGSDDYRMILEQSGDNIILNLAFYGDVLGQIVDVYAGCDHSISTCTTKFSNTINFGGCPFVPTKNIFQSGLD